MQIIIWNLKSGPDYDAYGCCAVGSMKCVECYAVCQESRLFIY